MNVGGDIGAICGRCGDVWHVVIAVADDRIARVECRECGARHRYRPVGGGAAASRKSAPGRGVRRSRAPEPVVEADPSRPRRPFHASDTYRVGDRVVHASFGEGVVQVVAGASKIRVLFAEGTKTLVHGRAGS